MSRIIPALPFSLPIPARAAPRSPIKAPDDHWSALAAAVNLAYATCNAGNVFDMWWPDDQWNRNTAGFEDQLIFRIPYLSDQHTEVRCLVYGASPGGTGQVKFSSVNAGNSVTINIAGTAWYIDTLDVSGGFGPHAGDLYEEITVEGKGDLEVQGVVVQYLDLAPNGDYPAADDELPAGPTADLATGLTFIPLDSDEFDADSPLTSDMLKAIADDLAIIDARPRVIYNWSWLENAATGNGWMAEYPHRAVVPVKPGGTTVTVWIYAAGGAEDGYVYVQLGPGARQVIADRSLATGSIYRTKHPLAGLGWQKLEVNLRPTHDVDAPRTYPGFTHISVIPSLTTDPGDTAIASVLMFAR